MAENVNHRRIVVGLDASEPAKQALRWAVRQAALTGASVEVVHAWQIPATDGWTPTFEVVDNLTKAGERLVSDAIAAVSGDHPAVTIHAQVVERNPASVLLEVARGADLLVLGSRGHGGFVGALLGSVSQHCVQHATCPVVVVRGPHR